MPTGALSLLDIAKTQADGFTKSVIQTYASAYHPMSVLPLLPAVGGRHAWNVEYQLPHTSTGARNFNASFSATRMAVSPFGENVKLYGGRIQVDRAMLKISPETLGQQRLGQIKAKAYCFTKDMFEGAGGTYLRGIKYWLDNETAFAAQSTSIGTASACSALLTDHLDILLNDLAVIPGQTFIYTTNNLALRVRKLSRGNAVANDVPYNVAYTPRDWGLALAAYNGVPVIPLVDGKGSNLLAVDDGDGECGVVYGVTFGTEMFTGFQQGPPELHNMTQADSYEYHELEHLVGTAPRSLRCIARLRYVTDAQ